MDSLMLHQSCGRCGERIDAPDRVVVVHRDCLLRGLSVEQLKNGKSRRAVNHERGSSLLACEVCHLDGQQISLLDLLIHPACLQGIGPKAGAKSGKRPKSFRPRQRSGSVLRGGFSVCPSCGRPIQQSGKCGCT